MDFEGKEYPEILVHLRHFTWMLTLPACIMLIGTAVAQHGPTAAQLCHQQATQRIERLEDSVAQHHAAKGDEDLKLQARLQALEFTVAGLVKTSESAHNALIALLIGMALSLMDKVWGFVGWMWRKYDTNGRRKGK